MPQIHITKTGKGIAIHAPSPIIKQIALMYGDDIGYDVIRSEQGATLLTTNEDFERILDQNPKFKAELGRDSSPGLDR